MQIMTNTTKTNSRKHKKKEKNRKQEIEKRKKTLIPSMNRYFDLYTKRSINFHLKETLISTFISGFGTDKLVEGRKKGNKEERKE